MLADIILIHVPVKITKMIFRYISMITRKRYDLIYYHTLGRQLGLITEINGIKFDASYKTPWLRAERLLTKEPDTIHWINEQMVKGDVLFDIGANIGTYSLYAASKGVKVFAFEPESGSYAILNNNIKINSYSNYIKALNIALNDRNIISELNVSDFQPGKSGHSFEHAINEGGENYRPEFLQTCIGYRLDGLIKDFLLPIPNHIKIDVDGNEKKVIDGFGDILSDKRLKSIMIEINLKNKNQYDFLDMIKSKGFMILDEEKYINKDYVKTGVQNYFFVKLISK